MPEPSAPPESYSYYGSTGHLVEDSESAYKALLFDDKSVRKGFIRKVFALISIELLVFVGFIAWFVFEPNTNKFVKRNQWMYWVSYIIFLIAYLTIGCCEGVRRKFPGNYICLIILTLAISWMAASLSVQLDTEIVLLALGICSGCCLAVVVFSVQPWIDFTKYVGIVAVCSFVLFFFGIFAIIFSAILGTIEIVTIVYSSLAALLIMVYLAIDIQMLMGGRKIELSPEDYIFAASQIFVDIALLFMYLLVIIAACRGQK